VMICGESVCCNGGGFGRRGLMVLGDWKERTDGAGGLEGLSGFDGRGRGISWFDKKLRIPMPCQDMGWDTIRGESTTTSSTK